MRHEYAVECAFVGVDVVARVFLDEVAEDAVAWYTGYGVGEWVDEFYGGEGDGCFGCCERGGAGAQGGCWHADVELCYAFVSDVYLLAFLFQRMPADNLKKVAR